MRRKLGQPTFPTLFFRDGILSVPGYTFEKASPWDDTGSMTILAEGNSLKDGSNVLAKIAPAQSNGSMCLEREAHILGKMSSTTEGSSVALRMIDYLKIPRENGDCVVLLLVHPGPNFLGKYLPVSKINDLLLADITRPRPTTSHGDVYMQGAEDFIALDNAEAVDTMDLATFLEFAIQATHCLEVLHKASIVHREVRANAFHLNSHSGLARLVHFGNRSISLENYGSPSSLVLRAYDEKEKLRIKEALCYLAPEQTGSIETMTQDHRTDLYSLGILFWTLLVGRGQMPFEGGALELLHSIVQKRPMPVHEVRRDVPQVIADIIDKLLAKNPDSRYQSAHGLKTDLIECQQRLLAVVSSAADVDNYELIPLFEIAKEDRFMEFTLPITLFGRERELELIRNVIRNTSTSFSHHYSASKGHIPMSTSPPPSNGTFHDERSDSLSSRSASPPATSFTDSGSLVSGSDSFVTVSTPLSPMMATPADGLRRVAFRNRTRVTRTQAVIVVGPPGIGKSSMILVNQAKWRSHGLWGQAKFQSEDSAPFAALLGCLSSVLRQLMVFHTDLHRFVDDLKARLGPQLQNVPLLYQGTPELKDVLAQFNIHLDIPQEPLSGKELRARFQSLVESVFSVIADTRLFALFLDDLHEADDSTLDLVSTLVNSRSRMLVFATLRSDKVEVVERVRAMFNGRSRPTWINAEPLNLASISTMIAKTLHRNKEDCVPLSRFVYHASSGNAFSARSILMALQRQHLINFDWEKNHWTYDIKAIEGSIPVPNIIDPADLTFLTAQMRELPEAARKYLTWAAFFGETFKVTEVALMMDWEDSSGSVSGSEDSEVDDLWNLHKAVSNLRENNTASTRGSMRGLQQAVAEGWLISRAREMCSFAHDRYRQAAQAEAGRLPQDTIAKMSFRIILMMLHENPVDVYRVAEHAKRCLELLRNHPKRDELLDVLIEAGESAWARGAHELAIQSFVSARSLLSDKLWTQKPTRTYSLSVRLAELYTWKGEIAPSDSLLEECYVHCQQPEEQANILRLRSRNFWFKGNFSQALDDTLLALKILGVEVKASPTRRDADAMFEQVKNEILAVGFDEILSIPRTSDPRTELAVHLLTDAGMNAYWSSSPYFFADVIGLTTIQLTLRSGMSPGTALGFFWALGQRRDMHRFSADLAKLALRIAERYGTSGEKCRAQVLYCSMVSGFENVHIKSNIKRLDQAAKYGSGAGDRFYTSFATIHSILTKLYVAEPIGELLTLAEECISDMRLSSPGNEPVILATAVLNCIRALGGYTNAESADTLFDTDQFEEKEYVKQIMRTSGNVPLALNWYNSFKVISYYSVGHYREAASLGFGVYKSREAHPNHRHVRYALFFHSLALIACLRHNQVPESNRTSYLKQIRLNQAYLRKWLSASPVNNATWVAIVDAEVAALEGLSQAFKLYDQAVRLASSNDWPAEEAWALFLQGAHFVRCGVIGLGSELQRRGITKHQQWGAQGIVNHLTVAAGLASHSPLKNPLFSCDVAVQTEAIAYGYSAPAHVHSRVGDSHDGPETSLSAPDLAAILQWSQEISSDINLSSALRRLTEIGTETSGAEHTCVVITREAGDYTVATSMTPPGPCQVHEHPKPIRTIDDPLQRAVIHHALNSKERIIYDDASQDSRFSSEAGQSLRRSVVCLPIHGNRGQTHGAIYFSSRYPFSANTLTILTLLCQQASISISNSLLFRSVQAGTKENLKMIASQKEALEEARRSREEAVKATKIKSNFLASMSHELRTPFSSFYGLLDLLSGTELNPGQNEIVQTAKQSCELLLKIIDSILDYSKLEASAVKLEPSGFLVENIIADCMELLLPMAARKLDLSFNIEPDVPNWVYADYARIRQVLMNLIGNAVKFTATGSVRVTCSVVDTQGLASSPDEVHLRFEIRDTGIGLSASDIELLFMPFQQADNSSTRRFGGTGLGLSISRQLVKLMGGGIGVTSEPDRGSLFWFTIPVQKFRSDESDKYAQDIEKLRYSLQKHKPPTILICSGSPATVALLNTMLKGFEVRSFESFDATHRALQSLSDADCPLDFIILDAQAEPLADQLARFLQERKIRPFQETKIIHLYTPTSSSSGRAIFAKSNTPGVVKMTKPPRQARLLQTLAGLKNLPTVITLSSTEISKAAEDVATAQRSLFGNVLIAEDNPIAQNLLVKQLERYQLHVVATSNGEEAISEWESHPPGYFSVALFDHHMPICDGVEAAKRLRMLERKRKDANPLPIVALSADCQESTKQLCLSAGMNTFFSKPLRKNDVKVLLTMFGAGSPPT